MMNLFVLCFELIIGKSNSVNRFSWWMLIFLVTLPYYMFTIWCLIKASMVYEFDSFGVVVYFLKRKKRILWEEFKEKQLVFCTYPFTGTRSWQYSRCARFSQKEKGKIKGFPVNLTQMLDLSHVWGDIYVYFNDDIPKYQQGVFDIKEEAFMQKLEEWDIYLDLKRVY